MFTGEDGLIDHPNTNPRQDTKTPTCHQPLSTPGVDGIGIPSIGSEVDYCEAYSPTSSGPIDTQSRNTDVAAADGQKLHDSAVQPSASWASTPRKPAQVMCNLRVLQLPTTM